jgi:hypothetical protein
MRNLKEGIKGGKVIELIESQNEGETVTFRKRR